MIRAFVALPLPDRVAWALEGAQAGLPVGRAVPVENFHVTLVFLGELPGTVLEDVHDALSGVRAPAFSIAIDGVGLFGGATPSSLHARVTGDPGLAHLQAKVEQAARRAGVSVKAGRFVPHVTLARFGQGLRGEDAERVQHFVAQRLSLAVAPFEVGGFTLYRSRLGKTVAYEALADYPLDGGGAIEGAAEGADRGFSAGW